MEWLQKKMGVYTNNENPVARQLKVCFSFGVAQCRATGLSLFV
jgi:hypothetical protein